MIPWKRKTILPAQEFSYQQYWMIQQKSLDEVKAKNIKDDEAPFSHWF